MPPAFIAVKAVFRFLLLLGISAAMCGARAHVDARVNMRAVHFDYHEAGMTAYYRVSLPLVAGGRGPAASYFYARQESGHSFYYADQDKLRADPAGAAALLAAGHAVRVQGRLVAPTVLSAAAHPKGAVPPFATVAQARLAAATPSFPAQLAEIDIGHVLLDVAVLYPAVRSTDQFEFGSTLDAGQLSEAPVRNFLVSHAGGKETHYASNGLLNSPITINPPILDAVMEFSIAGSTHILEGFDHLLFVICLVLGDLRLRSIGFKITGFSVGHSLSLVAGFYGWLPGATWFGPTVELLIALSVLGSALLMLGQRSGIRNSTAITCLVGLVHGCGLAFGLREMLSDTGPNILASLLSFNLGVEAGQLLVGGAIWLAFSLVRTCSAALGARLRTAIALASIAVSLSWVIERVLPVWDLRYL